MISWQTAIHEAGHAAAAIALGGTVSRASLGDDGSGVCVCEANSRTEEALVTAAGPIAAELITDALPPASSTDESTTISLTELQVDIELSDRQFIAAKDVERKQERISDARHLALWAIAGCEEEPERWPERVAFANHVASQIVADHREEIVRIATLLFRRHTIFQEEILTAFHNSTQPQEITPCPQH